MGIPRNTKLARIRMKITKIQTEISSNLKLLQVLYQQQKEKEVLFHRIVTRILYHLLQTRHCLQKIAGILWKKMYMKILVRSFFRSNLSRGYLCVFKDQSIYHSCTNFVITLGPFENFCLSCDM